MFSSSKIFAACIAVVIFSSDVHAEKEVAETLGLLGLHGLGVGVGVGGYPGLGIGVGVGGYPGVDAGVYTGVGAGGYGGYPVNNGNYASASASANANAGAGATYRKLRSAA